MDTRRVTISARVLRIAREPARPRVRYNIRHLNSHFVICGQRARRTVFPGFRTIFLLVPIVLASRLVRILFFLGPSPSASVSVTTDTTHTLLVSKVPLSFSKHSRPFPLTCTCACMNETHSAWTRESHSDESCTPLLHFPRSADVACGDFGKLKLMSVQVEVRVGFTLATRGILKCHSRKVFVYKTNPAAQHLQFGIPCVAPLIEKIECHLRFLVERILDCKTFRIFEAE